MKKPVKILLCILLAVIVLIAAVVGGLVLHSKFYKVSDQASFISNTTGLVQASGRSLYDPQGKRLQLTGINAGQILLQETLTRLFLQLHKGEGLA